MKERKPKYGIDRFGSSYVYNEKQKNGVTIDDVIDSVESALGHFDDLETALIRELPNADACLISQKYPIKGALLMANEILFNIRNGKHGATFTINNKEM